MSFRVNLQEVYTQPDGHPTIEMVRLLKDYERRMTALEGLLTDIAAVTKPTGGATIDAEARTAIDAIIDAAT